MTTELQASLILARVDRFGDSTPRSFEPMATAVGLEVGFGLPFDTFFVGRCGSWWLWGWWRVLEAIVVWLMQGWLSQGWDGGGLGNWSLFLS